VSTPNDKVVDNELAVDAIGAGVPVWVLSTSGWRVFLQNVATALSNFDMPITLDSVTHASATKILKPSQLRAPLAEEPPT
jgi:hypothetical protein